MKVCVLVLFSLFSSVAHSMSCEGKITRVNHWSDGQDNKVNFKLKSSEGSMWVQTKTKEQVSMVLMSLASKNDVKVHWSCGAPTSCAETASQTMCGYLEIINE